jgi:hypothetical protein
MDVSPQFMTSMTARLLMTSMTLTRLLSRGFSDLTRFSDAV